MKFTLSWLKEYLDTKADLQQIAEGLVKVGLEVESIQDRAATYAPFKVAYIEKAEKHPDADRLKVCIVDTGIEKLQVVCGAPNARAGMKGIFAPAGSVVPATGSVLKKGNIRGQESNGMMVSEAEMALPITLPDGIIEIADNIPLGTPLADIYGLNDPVIDIAITPNRADACGVYGVARDLAAAGLGVLKPLNSSSVSGSFKSSIGVNLKFSSDDAKACPIFAGRLIKNVKNGPSPQWLQDRLKAIGLRPISALVDITNFMTIGFNRPLHVFDADKLQGNIEVRFAKNGESFKALNGKDYKVSDQMIAICDASGLLGLGGIIGGESTGCSEETTNVFVESAYFDPLRVARAGRALQIDSDARYRFERGIDPEFTIPGLEIATQMILECCAGEASEIVVAGRIPAWQKEIFYHPDRVETLGGRKMDQMRQKQILSALSFQVNDQSSPWLIHPPSWRGDVEGASDIVEELLRIDGFDHIPTVSLPHQQVIADRAETIGGDRGRRTRISLAARGLQECITWSFVPEDWAKMFGGGHPSLKIANPINAEMDQMRPTPLPNLVHAASRNAARGYGATALFEVGPAFEHNKPDGQRTIAAGIRAGNYNPRHWSGAHTSRQVDAYDAKADALCVLEACGLSSSSLQISAGGPQWYHPGRSGTLKLGQVAIGYFGELYPTITKALESSETIIAFEIYLDRLPVVRKKSGSSRPALKLNALQPLNRDFAFIVDAHIEADQIVRTVRAVNKSLILDAQIFDVYQGKGVEIGKKSVALTMTVQPIEKTLTDAEIEALSKQVIDAVVAKTGASLRA